MCNGFSKVNKDICAFKLSKTLTEAPEQTRGSDRVTGECGDSVDGRVFVIDFGFSEPVDEKKPNACRIAMRKEIMQLRTLLDDPDRLEDRAYRR